MIYGYTRPRYQVSVYRTIGPPVYVIFGYIFNGIIEKCKNNDHTKFILVH